jgi:hypothetical protein
MPGLHFSLKIGRASNQIKQQQASTSVQIQRCAQRVARTRPLRLATRHRSPNTPVSYTPRTHLKYKRSGSV